MVTVAVVGISVSTDVSSHGIDMSWGFPVGGGGGDTGGCWLDESSPQEHNNKHAKKAICFMTF